MSESSQNVQFGRASFPSFDTCLPLYNCKTDEILIEKKVSSGKILREDDDDDVIATVVETINR